MVGYNDKGFPVDANGDRVPQSLSRNSPNAGRPGAGYGRKNENGIYVNKSSTGQPSAQDPDWIPEVGAVDPVLRAATTREQIIDHLTEKYKDRNYDFSDFKNPNYVDTEMDLEATREAAQAFDDMLTKYPFITFTSNKPLRAVYAANRPKNSQSQTSNAFASADSAPVVNGELKRQGASFISLNAPMATTGGRNLALTSYGKGRRDSETRDYNLDAMNRPTYYTMVHEMGHVMDFNGNSNSHARIQAALDDAYRESEAYATLSAAGPSNPEYIESNLRTLRDAWLSTRLVSAYSFAASDRTKSPYIVESIAEAFLDVETRGDDANALSKLIHQIVVEEAKKAKGLPV